MEFTPITVDRAGVIADCLALLALLSDTSRTNALRNFDAIDLQEMLETVEARLGTPHERKTDLDLARLIAHQLRNHWAAILLRRAGLSAPAIERISPAI